MRQKDIERDGDRKRAKDTGRQTQIDIETEKGKRETERNIKGQKERGKREQREI